MGTYTACFTQGPAWILPPHRQTPSLEILVPRVAAALHASALRRGPNRLGAAVAGSGDGSVYSRLHQLRLRLPRRPRGGEAPGP